MKTLYLDLFSGISGDMFIGALLDLGVDPEILKRELQKLKLDGYHLHVSRGEKSGIAGTKFDVHLAHDHDHDHNHAHGHDHHHDHPRQAHGQQHHEKEGHSRTFKQIKDLITRSTLSPWVKQKAVAVFWRIAVAEGKIHGIAPEKVHFHEVGAVDSIIDVVGACIALEKVGKPRVLSSAVVEGVGWVDCAHGRFPVPAPATLAILGARGVGVTQCDEPHELVTPTGAALLAEFAEAFGPMSGLVAEKIGFGLGTRDNRTRPNVLRAILGSASRRKTAAAEPLDWETDSVAVLETNLDDINAEILGHFVEKAFRSGALDVFHTPVQMKKNRPGVLLTVLCSEADADKLSELVLRETTAFGLRRHVCQRRKLRRDFKTVKTPFGEVTVKVGTLNGEVVQASPEYESCKQAAERHKVALKSVYESALRSIKRR